MNRNVFVLPIRNSGNQQLKIELEPEGNWFPLEAGEKCEVRLIRSRVPELDLELEIQNELVLVHCSTEKSFWKNGIELK